MFTEMEPRCLEFEL